MADGNLNNNQISPNQQASPLQPQKPNPVASDGQVPVAPQQQSISVGSPEAGPMVAASPETTSGNVEFGYEKIKQIEQGTESHQGSEKKEVLRPVQPQAPRSKPQPKPKSKPMAQKPQSPKFFGYKVNPQIANNLQLIKKKKGKGKTDDAKTWIYVLLDRILKKQTYNN